MPMQDAIIDAVREQIRSEPEWYTTVLDYLEQAESGALTIDGAVSYKDLFLQQYHGVRDPVVAGFLIGQIHAYLASGRAAAIRVEVGATPARDKNIAENAKRLEGVRPPFVGFTDPETLIFHLYQTLGFARWPYGVEEIVAIRMVRPDRQP